jgi:uncharacterized protein YacL
MAFLSACILAIAISQFVHTSKRKKIGEIKVEEVTFARNFVFRTFFKPKDLWIVYDKRNKSFRPADFREMPIKVGLTLIFGILILYLAFLILSNLLQFPEFILIRTIILIILIVIGSYDFFVTFGRIASLGNKRNKEVCNILNKNRSLKNFINREKAYFEITPNFTTDGFVTSVEVVTHRKYDPKKIEKLLLQVSRRIM